MRIATGRGRGADRLAWARRTALYLLSLQAVIGTLATYDPGTYGRVLFVAGAALGLAVALLVGELLAPILSSLVDHRRRLAVTVSLYIPYGGAILIAVLVLLGNPRREVLQPIVLLFAFLQFVLLLFAGYGRGYLGALHNALVLVVLTSLVGGVPAALAVTGFLACFGFFVVLDNAWRKVTGYASGQDGVLGAALRRGAAVVLPVVAGMAAVFALAPPTPFAPVREVLRSPSLDSGQAWALWRDLLLLGALGWVSVYLVAYLITRGRDDSAAARPEIVEARRIREEPAAAVARRGRREYPGVRGRIVRAYVEFLRQAAKLGLGRPPHRTPREFAAAAALESLDRLTELFVRARYGAEEPAEEEAGRAERAAQEAIRTLRERPAAS